MPRSCKARKVCGEYQNKVFTPKTGCHEFVVMNIEEMEALRLCDYEGLEQTQAAEAMHISRGTLQRILYSARLKAANALCNGKEIRIEGGNYEVKCYDPECDKGCKYCRMKSRKKEN